MITKLIHVLLITLLVAQNLIYPWISILPAPPPALAQESPPIEATYSAQTPAPSPLDPLLNLDTIFPSTTSAETIPPEAVPEATQSAKPEAIPEATISATPTPSHTPTPTPSASPSPTPVPSPTGSPENGNTGTPNSQTTPSPSPTGVLENGNTGVPEYLNTILPLLPPPASLTLSYPFSGTYPVSYGFGETSDLSYVRFMQSLFKVEAHDGLDFAMQIGTPILAASSGTVSFAGSGTYGTTIIISHAFGQTYYGHLSQLVVQAGDQVSQGQIIGYSGNSGITTGPHLHFGLRPVGYTSNNGYHGMVDPTAYFSGERTLGVSTTSLVTPTPRHKRLHHERKFKLSDKALSNDELKLKLEFDTPETHDINIILTSPKGIETELTQAALGDLVGPLGQTLTLNLDESLNMTPGKYELTIIDSAGSYDVQDFTWGVLAINTNRATYLPGSRVDIAMAVLNNLGDMICDAKVELVITSPSGQRSSLSSQNGDVTTNQMTCLSKGFTLTPDYQATFQPTELGAYSVVMTATTDDGPRTTSTSFSLADTVPFDVERLTITRIYPRITYPVILRVHAFEDYQGVVEDVIPAVFELVRDDGDTSPAYTVTPRGSDQVIKWQVDWQKDHDYVLTYQFDPPDKSPDFYTLGPLQIGTRFSESKKWQLAIDVTTTVILNYRHTILTSGTTWTVPSDWTSSDNTIEVIGGGGAGRTDTTGAAGAGGGGGGAYAKSVNISLTGGASVDYQIGQGGTPISVNGTDTFFNRTSGTAGTCADTTSVCAKGGTGATSATGAAGGLASSSFATGTGNAKNDGGTGGTGNTTSDSGGGGGGAGGPNGAGGTGGAGDTDNATDGVGGGGGGNGGGSAGGSGITSDTVGAAGGNGNGGTGGGTGGSAADGGNGTAGTGAGGGGGADNFDGGNGANGTDFSGGTVGSGGGGGGTGDTATTTGMGGNGGLYGAGGGGGRYGGFGAPGIIVITYNSLTPTNTSWTVPADWNDADNTIIAIGGGGAGVSAAQGTGEAGGGGGGYSKITNLDLTPGGSVAYQIGAGGRKTTVGAGAGLAGGATFFNRTAGTAGTCADTVSVCANGGSAGSGTTGGGGGSTTGADGTTLFAGGAGGAGNSTGDTGGGGGGAGGTAVGQVGGAGSSAATNGGGGGGGGAGGTSSSVGQAGQTTTGGTGGNGPAGTGSGSAGNAGHGGAGGSSTGGGGGGGDDVFGGGNGGSGSSTTFGGGGGGGAGDNNTSATSAAYGGHGGLFGGGGGGGLTNGFGAEGVVIITYTPLDFSIAGTADGNDGATVKVAYGSTLQAQTTTISSGTWTVSNMANPASNDIITVWIDGVADVSESTAVTKWSSGNITGMVLNTNVLSIGSNQDTSLTVSNLDTYDCTSDEDIMHQAVSSHFKVEGDSCAGSSNNSYLSEKLDILSGDTLTIGTSETLTTYDLTITGTLTSSGNSTYNVSHNWANSGTFTSSTSTVNLNGKPATTQTLSGSTSFNNLTTTNTSASWYNASWTYRQRVTIDHSKVTADQTDLPIYLDLSTLPSGFHTHVNQTDARDIRITKADGTTELPREIVSYTAASDTGELHFKYTGTLSSTVDTDIYIYYGNAGASDYAVNATYGANNVWDSSSKATYHLNQTASGTAGEFIDSTSTANHLSDDATSTKRPSLTTGKLGSGQAFVTANNQYLHDSATSGLGNLNSTQTLSVWYYVASNPATNQKLLCQEDSTYSFHACIYFTGSGNIGVGSDWNSPFTQWIATTVPSAATWHQITWTWNGTTNRLYIDGAEATNNTTAPGVSSAIAHIWVGNETNGAGTAGLGGSLDEIRIDNAARGATWISTTYNNQSSPSTFAIPTGTEATDGSRTITYTAGTTTTVTGTWTSTGASGSLINLGSSAASAWTINPTTAAVSYVSVSYSSNTGTTFCAASSTDGGNNAGWDFICTPTAYSFQRKTFYDDQNARYWRFSFNGTAILPEYSSNASSWTASTTLPYQTNDFDVGWKSISGTEYVYVSVASTHDIIVRRGTLDATSVTWDSTVSTALNGASNSDHYTYPVATIDSSNILWVGARYYNGTNYSYTTTSQQTPATITHQETVTGTAITSPTSVTSASITGTTGHLYLASISTKLDRTVSSVSGLGLTWTLVKGQCGGRGQTRTEVWYAIGTPSGSGTVTANFGTAPEEAVIAVSRYSGVSTASPIGSSVGKNSNGVNSVTCTGGTDAAPYTVNLTTTTDGSLAFGAVGIRQLTNSPGSGYTERADLVSTSGSGTSAGVAVEEKLVSSASTLAVDGTVSSAVDYSLVAVEAMPAMTTSTLADTISGWSWLAAKEISAAQSNANVYGNLFSVGSGKIYAALISNTTIQGCIWDTSHSRWENTAASSCASGAATDSIATSTAGITNSLSGLVDGSYYIHLTYINGSGQMTYQKRTTSWQTAVTLDSSSGNGYPTIALNSSNSDLYAFWIRSDDIFYKKSVTPYGSGDWDASATSWKATGVNTYVSANIAASNNIFAEWYDGSALAWDILSISPSNTAPNSPSSLAQKTTSDVTLATGNWHNSTSIKFTATATDPDSSDTLYLCVEADLLGVSFSNTEDSCGTGVAYSGSGVTVTHTLTLTDASEYHWQARVKDTAGAYSSWVSYDVNAESARDVGIDTTAPTGGTIYDGTSAGSDITYATSSLSSLSANWDSFNMNVSGLSGYEYSIGTSAGATDIKAWTSNSTTTSVTATGLTLHTSLPYYFNVRVTDNAGNVSSVVSSNGQIVSPSISFTVSTYSLNFLNLNPLNSYTDTQNTTLTTSTNAYNGYVIRAFITDYLRNGATTIADFNGGTYASPGSWAGSETGFGYTSSDTTIQGSNKFASGTLYAPFNHTGPGDIVADHTTTVSGTEVSNEAFTMTYKIKLPTTQAAKTYSGTVVYTATAQY